MYTGPLAATTNRKDLQFNVEVVDNDTGEDIDLTGATISVAIRLQDQLRSVLTGSTDDGKVTITATGVFQVWFTPTDVHDLVAGSYDIGITVKLASGITYQLLVGTLPVIDGIIDP